MNHRSSPTWQNSAFNSFKYSNPVSKIHSLIRDLDKELQELRQYTIPQKHKLGSNTNKYKNYNGNSKNVVKNYSGNSRNTASQRNMVSQLTFTPARKIQNQSLVRIYRDRVNEAYRNRRIFIVYGNYHSIRRELLSRGWIEKLLPYRYPKLQGLSVETLLMSAKRGNDFEAVAISKLCYHMPAFFVWQPSNIGDLYTAVQAHRNRIRRSHRLDFSTKIGLIGCAEYEQWYRQSGVCGMSYPRFYRLDENIEERLVFINDFKQTQCRSLLKYIRDKISNPATLIDEVRGKVSSSVVKYALSSTKNHVDELEHNTLDDENESTIKADTESVEWNNFMYNSNEIVNGRAKFKMSLNELTEYEEQARLLLNNLESDRPDYKWDGHRNLWILKPGFECRGVGIIIRNTLNEILQWARNNQSRRYIAQKYIEHPLLIYKTKFDIRQYMLVCIGKTKLTIWLYKDCYLRFSSQEFSINDLRESIHLTNNSVQIKYQNKPTRHPYLPRNNMWSLDQFKVYLRQHAPENIWNNRVFPGFKENLITVIMTSLEETDMVENAFELYGCDFMLDKDYNPILIEINSTPDMSPSTEVTARLCPMTLKDVVKVIVDLPGNPKASTGLFELAYEVDYKINNNIDPQLGLDVSGKAMTLNSTYKASMPCTQRFFKSSLKILKKTKAVISSPLKKLKNEHNEQGNPSPGYITNNDKDAKP